MSNVYHGTFIHCKSSGELEILLDYVCQVSPSTGIILAFQPHQQFLRTHTSQELESINLYPMKDGEFMIPGFINTHTHAPQYLNNGLGIDLPLLKWLTTYTFPLESMFKDVKFAGEVYDLIIETNLSEGITTCCYFATIHSEASLILGQTAERRGQRAFIGKVCMDRNSFDDYIETTEKSLENTEKFINQMKEHCTSGLVVPIITPRFAPSCSLSLMKGLGVLAETNQLLVQTHLSENKDEVEWVKALHPDLPSYTQVYSHCDLLNRAVLAHGIFLSSEELDSIQKADASVSHCPLSNLTLSSGILDVRRLMKKGITVSLGTDCSGGYSPSMLNAIRTAILSSQALQFHRRDHVNVDTEVEDILKGKALKSCGDCLPLTYTEAFYLATLGGAKSLHIESKVGNFEVGKEFDSLLISTSSITNVATANKLWSLHPLFNDKIDFKKLFQQFLMTGDDRNIINVHVRGKSVFLKRH